MKSDVVVKEVVKHEKEYIHVPKSSLKLIPIILLLVCGWIVATMYSAGFKLAVIITPKDVSLVVFASVTALIGWYVAIAYYNGKNEAFVVIPVSLVVCSLVGFVLQLVAVDSGSVDMVHHVIGGVLFGLVSSGAIMFAGTISSWDA